ncbi:MAG: aspartate aminotransferase family protein [Acidobacteria bacterium]|nr:aspartate aminotransferase family protein [Acidobacteriota bacterium]
MDTMEKYRRYVNTHFLKKVQPIVVDRALGAKIWDETGREFVDLFSGISVVNAGHGRPEIVDAAAAQMRRLVHCNSYIYHNKPTADFAEALASIMPAPDLRVSFFGNSGAEAIEGAMRLAKQATGRSEFVALEMSFHGRTAGTLSVTGNWNRKKKGGPYLPGVAFAQAPFPYRSPYGSDPAVVARECARDVERAIDLRTSGDVAAFIAEPVLGEGGIIVPPPEYFKMVKEILDRRGILFICDEVQSGFGRTGRMLAIEHYGVVPDIVVTAKGIAGGFPLSAFTTRDEIARAFTPGDHLSTFGGNPVSCAAALANLAVFRKDRLVERSAAAGGRLFANLRELQARHPLIGDVRGMGLMAGIELVTDRDRKTPAAEAAAAIQARLLEEGFLAGVGGYHGNVLRVQPPLVIEDADLDRAVAALDRALARAR